MCFPYIRTILAGRVAVENGEGLLGAQGVELNASLLNYTFVLLFRIFYATVPSYPILFLIGFRLTNIDSFLQANLIILTIPHIQTFLIYREDSLLSFLSLWHE